MRNPTFVYAKTKTQISTFVFATQIVHSLYFLNPKFQASSHLLWLYSPVCVRSGRNPEDRFSRDLAQIEVTYVTIRSNIGNRHDNKLM